MEAIALDLSPIINLTDEQFFQLCQHHRDYRFERKASGEIIIMPPTGGETGRRNAEIAFQLPAKMREYMDNGVRLSWLLDRQNRRVEIYRTGQIVEMLPQPNTLSGEQVLPEFILDLTEILD